MGSKKTRHSFSVSPEVYNLASKYAPLVGESASSFVGNCIFETCNALESNELLYDFPVLQRWRAVLGKKTLVSRLLKKICALAEPDDIDEISQEHWKYMFQLLDEHEKEQKGPVDAETRKLYWNQAIELNKLRIAREKQLAKIKKSKG